MSAPERHDGDTDEGLVDALGERLSATLERWTTTARLALAETRLAAASAALLLGIALACALLALPTWLLLTALAGYGLWQLGLTPGAALGILLAVHVGLAALLAFAARRLAGDLRFAHTRRALAAGAPPPVPAERPDRAPAAPPAPLPSDVVPPPAPRTPVPEPPPSALRHAERGRTDDGPIPPDRTLRGSSDRAGTGRARRG